MSRADYNHFGKNCFGYNIVSEYVSYYEASAIGYKCKIHTAKYENSKNYRLSRADYNHSGQDCLGFELAIHQVGKPLRFKYKNAKFNILKKVVVFSQFYYQ